MLRKSDVKCGDAAGNQMKKHRTYLDTGVLITAHQGTAEIADRAFKLIDDSDRCFVASEFLKLELLPKCIYFKNHSETQFYQTFFEAVDEWIPNCQAAIQPALDFATDYGLSAMDALHVASAYLLDAQLVSTEKKTKPMYRVDEIRVISLYDI